MSSLYVRTQVKEFITGNSDETIIDITALYSELDQVISDADLQPDAPWVGLQFVGGDDLPVSLAADNTQGLYRETGSIQIHIVAAAAIGVGDGLVSRGEVLRSLFVGRRIGTIVIDSVAPMNTESGATLEFDGGYMSGTFLMSFHRDHLPGA